MLLVYKLSLYQTSIEVRHSRGLGYYLIEKAANMIKSIEPFQDKDTAIKEADKLLLSLEHEPS